MKKIALIMGILLTSATLIVFNGWIVGKLNTNNSEEKLKMCEQTLQEESKKSKETCDFRIKVLIKNLEEAKREKAASEQKYLECWVKETQEIKN